MAHLLAITPNYLNLTYKSKYYYLESLFPYFAYILHFTSQLTDNQYNTVCRQGEILPTLSPTLIADGSVHLRHRQSVSRA